MITLKRIFISFIALIVISSVHGQAEEQGKTTPQTPPVTAAPQPPADVPLQPAQQTQGQTQPVPASPAAPQSPVAAPQMPPSAPLQIPPGTQITPEQIKALLQKPREENYIILNFDNADLRDVINSVSSITKENFILSPGLNAMITIHSSGRIPASEVFSVFESILEVNNMALVKSGQFYKIVPGAAVKQKPLEIKKGKDSEAVTSEDRPVTQIIPVEYVPVSEMTAIFQPLISQFGSIIPNPRNNLLIINDMASNIKRILLILKEIDVDAFQNTRMFFFQPKYSDVKTIADDLTGIVGALNLGREGGIAILPIERINSLIIFSASPSLLESVKKWVQKLDEEVTAGQNIYVYPIQNVKADTIANILKTIYTGEIVQKAKTPSQPVSQPGQPPQRPQPAAAKTEGTKVEIATFEPTNSLVILAPPGIYKDMVDTIKKLDIYPHEVLIEVLIAEVTLTDTDKFGIQWSALQGVSIEGDSSFTGRVQSSSGSSDAPSLSATAPALAGAAAGISYVLFKPDRLIAMIHALASKGKVDVLSSPRLLVRNQEEASIEVGSDIPTSSSTTQAADTTTTSTLTQSIEYKTVGIKLKIKPSINNEKTVVLDIEQEVSDQLSNVTVGQAGYTYPSFSTRKTKTSVVVPDKQTIVIGGIIKEKKDKSYQGIPLLSSIPLLGYFFRYTVDTTSKTELIIMLTPYVITNQTEADVITTEFMEKLKQVKDFLKKKEDQLSIKVPAGEEKK
ncbi:MAG: type II secretion system secretin GspD [Thermodesulfovibrionia bacterium]|nr:type II secretion system secretin GspD [Thermodesulfovibrionia bacterium]